MPERDIEHRLVGQESHLLGVLLTVQALVSAAVVFSGHGYLDKKFALTFALGVAFIVSGLISVVGYVIKSQRTVSAAALIAGTMCVAVAVANIAFDPGPAMVAGAANWSFIGVLYFVHATVLAKKPADAGKRDLTEAETRWS